MTFQSVWAIDGDQINGQLMRLQLQSATRSATGVVEIGDLKVTAKATATGAVTVAGGACVALGGEVALQGSYYGYNVGEEDVAISSTDGSGGRSDMVIAQVKDPTFDGSPWQDDDDPWSFQVISGVSSTATEVPSGITGVALARIDIPVSTSAITDTMIKNIRQSLAPRQLRQVFTATADDTHLTDTDEYQTWPSIANWDIAVPSWAAKAVVNAYVGGARFDQADADSEGGAFGTVRVNLGGTTTRTAGYDVNVPVGDNFDRTTIIVSDTLTLDSDLRGSTTTIKLEGIQEGNTGSDMYADERTTIAIDVEFIEATASDA